MSAASSDLFSRPSGSSKEVPPTEPVTVTVSSLPKKSMPPKSLEDILVYDTEAIAASYRSLPFHMLFRLFNIFWIASGYLL